LQQSRWQGSAWRQRPHSFDHKEIHFVVLNSILTHDSWMNQNWEKPMDRTMQMAHLDNPNGSPFMVGDAQRAWLKADLDRLSKNTPVVVFSHSPLQTIYRGWNFWTDDSEQLQAVLKPVDKVTVI
jgi:hypothetical protein